MVTGEAAPRGTTYLHGLEAVAHGLSRIGGHTSRDTVDDLAQRSAEGHLYEARIRHVAGKGKGLRARGSLRAHLAVPLGAGGKHQGHLRQGLHIVDHRRLAPEAADGREGRFRGGHAPFPLDGGDEGRFLSADEGAGALHYVQVEGAFRAEKVLAEQADAVGIVYGLAQALDGERVFGSYVYVAFIGLNGPRGYDHALDDAVGIAFHDAHVHEGARVSLVTIADDVLLCVCLAPGDIPLPSRGEAAASPSAQTRGEDELADVLGAHFEIGANGLPVSAGRDVFLYALGVDGAAVGKREAVLFPVEGDLVLGAAHPLRVGFDVEKPLHDVSLPYRCLHYFGDVARFHLRVEYVLGKDGDERPYLTEPLAAGARHEDALFLLLELDDGVEPAFLQGLHEGLVHLEGPVHQASRSRADEDAVLGGRRAGLKILGYLVKPREHQIHCAPP